MAKRRKKKKRRGSGGGGISGMRQGMKSFVGTSKQKKKQSPLSRLLTYLLFAAAVGVLIYRYFLN